MALHSARRFGLGLLVSGLALVGSWPLAASSERIAVIVHKERGALSLETEALAKIYLKQRSFWSAGEAIIPINREAGSRIRDRFSRRVLGRSAAKLRNYWNRRYFQGVLPPPTLASDEAVRRYVAREPRAIGYVDASSVDPSVRVVLSFEAP